MATKIRRWCDTHRGMAPHVGATCLVCKPSGPEPKAAPAAEGVLELVLAPKVTALDVIRARGDLGATVKEIIAAGADPAELVADVTGLEMAGKVETRYHGHGTGTRDGLTVFYPARRKEAA